MESTNYINNIMVSYTIENNSNQLDNLLNKPLSQVIRALSTKST